MCLTQPSLYDYSAREQNRLRKLQAQGTREWDTPKDRSETAAPPTGTATSEKSVSRQASAAEPPSPRSPAPRRVSAERKPSTSHPPTPAVPVTPVQVEANPTLAAVNLKSAPESTKSLASTPVAESDLASSSAAVGGVNADQPTVFPQKPAVDLALTRLPKLTESVHARPPAISGPSPAKSPTTIRRPPTDRKAPAYRPPSVRAQAKAKATTSAKPVPDVTVALPSSTPPKSVVEDLAAMIKSDAHINWDEDDDF
ncbi:hypothetical protein IWQ60_007149 [Tieghemiomyces parasiticus]|uniref:Uncharacterized protein n=1 Tax=Tieghemiomyces parasiticus TaxID=78921 RepID=A0A9W8A5W0_9FUNG|nr:hypothetical protein IWQ60_007149 [Tieghemiomyces parasiticus]